MTNFNTKHLIPGAMYRVAMTDPDFGSAEAKTMTGADLKELAYAVGHLYDMTADIIEATETEQGTQDAEQTTETTETTETAQDVERDDRIAELMQTAIDCISTRSAWQRGVKEYAEELMMCLRDRIAWDRREGEPSPLENRETVRAALLDGAEDWKQYSLGGCSLIYNGDIAERLCSPSELKRKRGGELPPNAAEDWLDVQARALYQASVKVLHAYDIALAALREEARV